MTREIDVDDLFSLLTIKLIMTPRTRMETCRDQEESADVVRRMESYDVLPVLSNGYMQFFVGKSRIEKEIKKNMSVKVGDIKEEISNEYTTSEDERIDSFLACGQPFLFVIKQKRVSGIVTYADLNKWPSKVLFYVAISRFEQLLIDAIETINLNHREIERYVGFWGFWNALGRYELEKRGNVELSVVQCLNTSDLVDVTCKEPIIREILGYQTISQARKYLNPIVDLRNKTMHAGHSLVESWDDVKTRKEQYTRIRNYISDLMRWLKKE